MWIPESEDELDQSLRAGALVEGHRVDFKRELGRSGPGQNKALAKDLASFALDGGVLVVGVAEEDEGFALNPIPLDGLRERIEQIATSRVEPPLSVVCRTFPSNKRAANGYLVVIVPPSFEAPHMVDGSYYGRGDSTNRVLSDAEVLRLHERRLSTQTAALDRLAQAVARDFSPGGLQAHMHVVAFPTSGSDDLLLRALEESRESSSAAELMEVVRKSLTTPLTVEFAPDFTSFGPSRRAGGWGLHPSSVAPGRQPGESAKEGRMLDLEVGENGSFTLFCDRASDSRERGGVRLLIEDLVAGLTLRVILAADAISQFTGYLGTWDFGLAITNTRGCVSLALRNALQNATPYSEEDYRQATRASALELTDGAQDVLKRLFGRFGRALNGGEVDLPAIRGRD